MAKTKTKGTAKTVSDTPVPQPITIRSTNPKIMADNILKLEESIKAADVSANPSGIAEDTLLTTIGIDGKKYDLGPSAENTSYDNTDSGLTATDTQAALDEIADQLAGQTVSGVSLTLKENVDFTIDKIDVKSVGKLAIIYLRLKTSTSITGNSEIEIGTFSGIEYVGHTAGAIVNNTNTALLGSYVITSDNKLYVNFTGNISQNTVVDMTSPCFISNS